MSEGYAIDNNALAKSYPLEDIQTHTNILLENLFLLKNLHPQLFLKWDRLYDLLEVACIYHDLGKLYPMFQQAIKNKTHHTGEVPHGVLSLAFIDYKWLKKQGFSKDDLKILSMAVAYHHDRKMPRHNEDIEEEFLKLQEPFRKFNYSKIPTRYLATEIDERYFSANKRFGKQDKDLFLRLTILQGLLNRLDYAASAHIPVEVPQDFLPAALENLISRWQKKDPCIAWNDLQVYMKENPDKNLIVIAQTGMGKTEAGLLWLNQNKGFFTLPLKSAINAIYDRIATDIVPEIKLEAKRVGLLHSDTYSEYIKQKQDDESTDIYYTRTKQLSLPLTVCTLDQLFSFVFFYRGFEHKLATLSYSKVIIDEVQMYSADLTAYLILGLQYISQVGGQFSILTATLPTLFVDLLKEMKIPFEPPRVFTNDLIRHSIKVIDKEINAKDITEISRSGKKILVICNTIKSAVKLFHQLQTEHQEVHLLHSHFTKSDRALKEKHILKVGHKDSTESGIWIATQIVEASLDIDFDLLFTELSDLNGLFQRMGRCYRNRPLDIPYNCFVFTGGDKLCSGVDVFIDKKIHQLSKETILKIDGVIDENQKVAMVSELYTKENLPEYYQEIKKAIIYIESCLPYELSKREATEAFRNIDNVSIIPRKVFEDNQATIENAIKVIKKDHKGATKQEKIVARNNISKYMVDISRYLANQIESEVIKINNYEQILIAECDYNDQVGIIRPVVKSKTKFADFSSVSF